jgi:hypothetical protein
MVPKEMPMKWLALIFKWTNTSIISSLIWVKVYRFNLLEKGVLDWP